MATATKEYEEQVRALRERFPAQSEEKITRLLRRHHGNSDEVGAILFQRDFRSKKCDDLESRFGPTVTELQKEFPSTQSCKRIRLLKIMQRFSGNVEDVRKYFQNIEERNRRHEEHSGTSRRERQEELKTKYATQLAELATAGINVNSPATLRQLEKNQGDVTKVIEKMTHRRAKKEQLAVLNDKYANQIAQLEADGIKIKNKRMALLLLEKANGQVDLFKQLMFEQKEKHDRRKEYRKKHRSQERPKSTKENDQTESPLRKRRELSGDDLENLKRLRSAGVHGSTKKILAMFHECNESIEMTLARSVEEREERIRNRDERKLKRTLLSEAQNAYLTISKREDWPQNIEQVYLDGNNMMFVIDSLRRLCLNRHGQKTERALAEIALAWNEQVRVPSVDLIFDATNQIDQIGSIKVTSAQPKYRTTDDMLVELVRKPENREKNKRTIVVTSDRALAVSLQHEGCLLIKPYSWFAHCVMILTPDLINYEELTGTITVATSPTTVKVRYNFNELARRIANIEL